MSAYLLDVKHVSCGETDESIFSDVNMAVNQGDVIVLQGRSGSGKTTLLKCIAHLNLYGGQVLYRDKSPKTYGVPYFRTKVSYVPQRPPILPGSPRDFIRTLLSLKVRSDAIGPTITVTQNIIDLGSAWGIEESLWDREWTTLSGGESQRMALATAVGLNTAEVLLLDEPTSALDQRSSSLVEQTLLDELRSDESSLKAIIWITHSEEQASRVGTRFIRVEGGTCHEQSFPPV
ncbi:P-loop containing nucleoside triphosphate hydrolase protein [Hymenopellis radicata]|nr:P-loop containing nucleoside triphosphate hydrolase protein [Hymenopellis radicata]